MLDPRVADLARRGLQPRLEQQLAEVRSAVGTVVAKIGANVILPGTPGAIHARRPIVAAVGPAVDLAWKNLWRVVMTLGSSPTADELKAELGEELAGFFEILRGIVREQVARASHGLGGEPAASLSALDIEIRRVLQIFEVEIDLFTHQPLRPIDAVSAGIGATFHFYSPVGAILTGSGSSATVVQRLDDDTRQALRSALENIRAALAELAEGTAVDTEEIAGMTVAAVAELNKDKPNGTMLGSLLLGVATTIQTVAAAHPAYAALKTAAAAVGITLP